MTTTYSGNFFLLLFRWKGSVWSGIWRRLLIYLVLYYCIRMFLIFCVTEAQLEMVKEFTLLFDTYTKGVSIEFLIAPYVMQVVTRWWNQVQIMPWPDDAIALFNVLLDGEDSKARNQRRLVARYILLSFVLAMRRISKKIRHMVPSIGKLLTSGLLTFEELGIFEQMPYQDCDWVMPLEWIQKLVRTRVASGDLPVGILGTVVGELSKIRSSLRQLFTYHIISLPLIYTQTATLLVYSYFGFCLIGHQFPASTNLSTPKHFPFLDIVFPFLTVLRFVICVGWLHSAEELWMPFGNEDENLDVDLWLQRHAKFAYSVAECGVIKDANWQTAKFSVDKCTELFRKPKSKKGAFTDSIKMGIRKISKRRTVDITSGRILA